jgi:hypothetical protein
MMDAGAGSPEEIEEAYRLLDEVNRRLGGHRLTREVLLPLVPAGGGRLAILDVAGGSGEFADRIVGWTRASGGEAHAIVLDRSADALAAAGTSAVCADALALPFPDRAIDIVHSSCFFHHLSTAGARDALAEMCRVSRRVVIVNDLVRSRAAASAIWGLARVRTRNRLVRADGPLAVRKGFRPGELLALALAVGASDAPGFRWRVRRGFPWRMALVGVRAA